MHADADLDEEPPATPGTPRPPEPPGRWSISAWGHCGNPCGHGEEERVVNCVLEDVSGTLVVAADAFCSPPRPATSRECYQYRTECANTWEVGGWSHCSARCGGGQRRRVVECRRGPGVLPPLADSECVDALRPPERRDCNLHPCPDGTRAWLRSSDQHRPRRIKLHSKFTLRCPFSVYYAPVDDRTKRRYAWYKDGERLPLYEDKYIQTDERGHLRVKGATVADSGLYTCASLTSDPAGKTHNITVAIELLPNQPAATSAPLDSAELEEDDEDLEQDSVEGTGGASTAAPTRASEANVTEVTEDTKAVSEVTKARKVTDNNATETAARLVAALRRRRDDSEAPAEPTGVVVARYDAAPFSNCSEECGPGGLERRAVRCVHRDSGAQLPLSACEDLGPPPSPQQPCNRHDCPPRLVWPPWTSAKCPWECGGGSKLREARCVQVLASGSEVTLGAEACGSAGGALQRRPCRRAPCRSAVREGEVARLACQVPGSAWQRGNSSISNGDRHQLHGDSGTLYVFAARSEDSGEYLCEAPQDNSSDGSVETRRFYLTVRPSRPPPTAGAGEMVDDDLIERVCADSTTTDAPLASPSPEPEGEQAKGEAEGEGKGEAEGANVEKSPPPWMLLFTPPPGHFVGVFN